MNSPNRDGYNTSYLSARLRLWSSRAWPRSGRFRERLADSPFCYMEEKITDYDFITVHCRATSPHNTDHDDLLCKCAT